MSAWHAVLRVWSADGGVYVYRHDQGDAASELEPAVLSATLRAIADDVDRVTLERKDAR